MACYLTEGLSSLGAVETPPGSVFLKLGFGDVQEPQTVLGEEGGVKGSYCAVFCFSALMLILVSMFALKSAVT